MKYSRKCLKSGNLRKNPKMDVSLVAFSPSCQLEFKRCKHRMARMKYSSLPTHEPEGDGTCVVSPFEDKPLGKTKVTDIEERIRAWREFYEPISDSSDANSSDSTGD
jgi:hypothetical protein